MRQEEAKQQETAPHFKKSSVLHPLAEQIKMVMEEKPYTLPHPIWSVRLYYHFVCRFVSLSVSYIVHLQLSSHQLQIPSAPSCAT